jgi:acyl dehydratase
VGEASNRPARELAVSFAELPSLAGEEFVGEWFVVDRSKLRQFDEATYTTENRYPVDDASYPEHLVEGFHLLALLDHLVNPILRVTDSRCLVWNYGFDRVRFVSPVRAGDEIRVRGVVGEVKPKNEGHLVLLRCSLDVNGRDRPGFVADWWSLWLRGSPLG